MLEVLADLKENRQLSFEVDEAIAPFTGKSFALSLDLVSSGRTIGNRFGPEYNDGCTLICALEADDLEISLQMTPAETAFVEGLAPGESFESQVTLLDFDTLYQRGIFGSSPDQAKPEDEPSSVAVEEQPVAEEPSVEPPVEAIEPEVEVVEPELVEPELIEPELIEPEEIEPEVADFETIEEDAEEEEAVGWEEDLQKKREDLLSQLNETVGIARADSPPSPTYDEERRERVDYEGEEPEWMPDETEPAPAPPPPAVSAPATTKEPEKQGCQNCSGCFKAIVVLLIIIFVLILVFSVRKELEPDTLARASVKKTPEESARHAFRKSALNTLGKKQPNQEDLFYLNETATMIWRKLKTQYPRFTQPEELSTLSKKELACGYAWVALAAEADGRYSVRAKLYENSIRKPPFHLLDDWHLIEAKVRIRLKNPHIELDERDFNLVKALDLSDERPENFSYLNQLPNLKQLTLSDDQNSRKQAQAIESMWPELRINYRKP